MNADREKRKLAAKIAAAQAAASINDKWREGAEKACEKETPTPEQGQAGGSSSSTSGNKAASGPPRRPVVPCLAPLVRSKLFPCTLFMSKACAFGFQCPLAHSLEEVYVARRPFQKAALRPRKRSSRAAAEVSDGSSGSDSGGSAASEAGGKRPRVASEALPVDFATAGGRIIQARRPKGCRASASAGAGGKAAAGPPSFYHRTRMCYAFLEGKCNKPRGECSFAHSPEELKNAGEARQAFLADAAEAATPPAAWWPGLGASPWPTMGSSAV